MSRGAGPGLSVEATSSIAAAVRKALANGPEVVVVSDMQDQSVPERVRQYDDEQRSQGATGEPEGFFYGGKVYLVAGQLNGAAAIVGNLEQPLGPQLSAQFSRAGVCLCELRVLPEFREHPIHLRHPLVPHDRGQRATGRHFGADSIRGATLAGAWQRVVNAGFCASCARAGTASTKGSSGRPSSVRPRRRPAAARSNVAFSKRAAERLSRSDA